MVQILVMVALRAIAGMDKILRAPQQEVAAQVELLRAAALGDSVRVLVGPYFLLLKKLKILQIWRSKLWVGPEGLAD